MKIIRTEDGKWWLSHAEALIRGGGLRFTRFDTFDQAKEKVWQLLRGPQTLEDWRELEERL